MASTRPWNGLPRNLTEMHRDPLCPCCGILWKSVVKYVGVLLVWTGLLCAYAFASAVEYDLGTVTSVALCDEAPAGVVNPAGLAVQRGWNGFLSVGRREHKGTDVSFFAAGRGLNFGYQRVEHEGPAAYRISTSLAGEVHRNVYVGTSYHANYGGGLRDFRSFDVGAMVRVGPSLSVGGVLRNVNNPKIGSGRILSPVRVLGLGLRPLSDRWTFFADGVWEERERWEEMDYRYGVIAEPVDGILVQVEGRRGRAFRVGLTVRLPHIGVGTVQPFDERSHRTGLEAQATSSFHAVFSKDRFRTIFQGKKALQRLTISGQIADERSFSLFGGGKTPLKALVDQIERGRRDPQIAGMILRVEGPSVGMGMANELREALKWFRESGKPIVCYLTAAGNYGYYIASAANGIVAAPAGTVFLTGLRAEVTFYKNLLDKIGVVVEVEKIGAYKSASEPLEREGMSEAMRSDLESVIGDRYERLVSEIAGGRAMDRSKVEVIVDQGVIDAADAQERGLVDRLGYYEDALKWAGELAGLVEPSEEKAVKKIRPVDLSGRTTRRVRWGAPPKIALVMASGLINTGRSGVDPLTGLHVMGSDTIAETLRNVREDEAIRAVVLRVDSGGGSALASDLIRREVEQMREAGKPMIVSVGNMAASGGYHIACHADTIVSNPDAIVGSIGVLAGKIALTGLYEKLGIRTEAVERGQSSGLFSLSESLTERQRTLIRESVERTYRDFVQQVAQGRSMSYEAVDSLGQGRIYTGVQGKANGLVDEIGGLRRAVEIAKEKAGISGEAVLVRLPRPRPFWKVLLFEDASPLSSIRGLLSVRTWMLMWPWIRTQP